MDILLSLVLLSVLFSFGTSRLVVMIHIVALQGVVVSVMPFFLKHPMTFGSVMFTMSILIIRGVIIPWSLYAMIKKMGIKRALEINVGYLGSLFFCLILIVVSQMLSRKFNLSDFSGSSLMVSTAISLIVAGLFLLMARRNAMVMVLGYIMMENGISLLGVPLSAGAHTIVEFGILLDVLAGVMIMGVMLQSIQNKYVNLDTAQLRKLKE
ncbi:hydrogenase [Desulfococcus sp.]|uniref:hydrogenase n=1 Tax=Desulfococcus sp. TaxID=2025834 RepID=UPI003593171C